MEIIMNDKYSKAYVEVLEIIRHMEKDFQSKVPQKLLDMFKQKSDKNYEYHIDLNKKINEQKLSEETIAILSVLELKYWATPEQKEILNKALDDNEKRYQEELRQKYNIDNLFKNKQDNNMPNIQENSIIKYSKKNFIQRIFEKIKSLFNK